MTISTTVTIHGVQKTIREIRILGKERVAGASDCDGPGTSVHNLQALQLLRHASQPVVGFTDRQIVSLRILGELFHQVGEFAVLLFVKRAGSGGGAVLGGADDRLEEVLVEVVELRVELAESGRKERCAEVEIEFHGRYFRFDDVEVL